MTNNSENFGFNQNALFTSNFLGFHEGSGDLSITPCPTVPQYNESRNDFFMSNSLENHGFPAVFGDLGQNELFMSGSYGILTGFEDLTITHPTIQQNNVRGYGTHISHSRSNGITFTYPQSGQNSVPLMSGSLGIWGGINHIGSSYDSSNNHGNTTNTSRNFSRSTNMVNLSLSNRQCKKRIRFRFVLWSDEEKQIMDRELLKCTFLPGFNICVNIAALLPKKSIRDVAMRIQWLIKHDKLDNIWNRVEPSLRGNFSDFSFYIPDNPNDPDLLAIRNRFGPRAVKRCRV